MFQSARKKKLCTHIALGTHEARNENVQGGWNWVLCRVWWSGMRVMEIAD